MYSLLKSDQHLSGLEAALEKKLLGDEKDFFGGYIKQSIESVAASGICLKDRSFLVSLFGGLAILNKKLSSYNHRDLMTLSPPGSDKVDAGIAWDRYQKVQDYWQELEVISFAERFNHWATSHDWILHYCLSLCDQAIVLSEFGQKLAEEQERRGFDLDNFCDGEFVPEVMKDFRPCFTCTNDPLECAGNKCQLLRPIAVKPAGEKPVDFTPCPLGCKNDPSGCFDCNYSGPD